MGYRYPLHLFFILPKLSYIINNCARSIPCIWQIVEVLYYSDKLVITFTAYLKLTF